MLIWECYVLKINRYFFHYVGIVHINCQQRNDPLFTDLLSWKKPKILQNILKVIFLLCFLRDFLNCIWSRTGTSRTPICIKEYHWEEFKI